MYEVRTLTVACLSFSVLSQDFLVHGLVGRELFPIHRHEEAAARHGGRHALTYIHTSHSYIHT